MKFMRIAFGCFCLLLSSVAAMNLMADPNDQPFKDISAILFLGVTAYGVFTKNKMAMWAFPAFFLVTTGMSFSNAKNIYAVLGGLVGAALPIGAWILIYKKTNWNAPEVKNDREAA